MRIVALLNKILAICQSARIEQLQSIRFHAGLGADDTHYGLRDVEAQVEVEGAIVHVGSRYADGFVVQESSGELDSRELMHVNEAAHAEGSLGHQRIVSVVSIPDTEDSASQ